MLSEIPKSVDIQRQLTEINLNQWLQEDVFHLKWWILIGLVLIFLAAWWILLDKSRLMEILLYTILMSVAFMGVNEYGEELILWDYPVRILPVFPPLSSINMLLIPLVYSIVYQHFKTRLIFLPAAAVTTLVLCFIIEPVFIRTGFIQLINWKLYEGIPVYLSIAVLIREAVSMIYRVMNKYNAAHNRTK